MFFKNPILNVFRYKTTYEKTILTSFLLFALAITTISNTRVCIGVVTIDVHPSALLEEISTTNGFLPPRITTSQLDLINSPASGLVTCNSTTNSPGYTTSLEWVQLKSDTPTSMVTISGNSTAEGGTITSGVVGLAQAEVANSVTGTNNID